MKLISKIASLSVGLALAVGVGVSLGSKEAKVVKADSTLEKTYDLSSALPSDLTSSTTLTLDSNGRGMGKASTTYTLTSTASYTNVSKIVVNAASNGTLSNMSLSITVGGDSFGSSTTLTNKASTDYTFESSASSGVVVVSANNAQGSKTIWVKTIEIYVDSGEPATGPFTVTYDGNGATSGSMTDSTEYESGALVTIKACEYMRTYYEVTGWNTKADGSGTSYVLSGQFNITANVTLYAQWALQSKTLDNGSYKAVLSYANPISSDIQLLNDSEQQVGIIGVESTGITYDDTHSEYLLAGKGVGKITFKNPTNAPLIKAVVNVYQYDNFKLILGSTTLHTGDGTKGTGDPVVFEITPETPSTDDVVIEHYSSSSSYTQKLYSVELYFKLGSEVVHPTSVELNAESGNVYVGKTRQLTATVLPSNADDRTVSWSSNNTAVATVDANGLVSGVSAGSATITATTNDGGLTASFVATVKALSYGTLENPLSVEEAREVLEITGSSYSSEQLFVTGTVYSSTYNSTNSYYTIWLQSSDGAVDRYFEVYKPEFDSSITVDYTDLKGAVVVASGYGQVYSGTTYELTPANSVAPTIESAAFTALRIAQLVLSDTKSLCDAYVDGTSDYDEYKASLTEVWSKLEVKYNTLSDSEKDILDKADRKEAGTVIEQAMARYDFLTGKYELSNFISGRTPIVPANGRYGDISSIASDNTMIIVISIAAVSALAFTMLLVFKKKKQK